MHRVWLSLWRVSGMARNQDLTLRALEGSDFDIKTPVQTKELSILLTETSQLMQRYLSRPCTGLGRRSVRGVARDQELTLRALERGLTLTSGPHRVFR